MQPPKDTDKRIHIYTTDPIKINNMLWICSVYKCSKWKENLNTFYYRDIDQWKDMTTHPKYNINDGTYAGLPKKLVDLYIKNKKNIKSALTGKQIEEYTQESLF